MSHYPPGVTGNEWQIAGPHEHVIQAECTAELPLSKQPCGFSGKVDGASIDGETWSFICPECGAEGEWLIEQEEIEWEDR